LDEIQRLTHLDRWNLTSLTRFMLGTIHPEIAKANGDIGQCAVVGLLGVGVDIPPEVDARDTHPRFLNHPHFQKGMDRFDEDHEEDLFF
jgi:hypothetical protein